MEVHLVCSDHVPRRLRVNPRANRLDVRAQAELSEFLDGLAMDVALGG